MHATGMLARGLPPLTRDGWLLFVTSGTRTFAYGFLSVMLGLYLARLGLATEAIGLVFSAALAGGAAMTVLLSTTADRLGRRRLLRIGALLMALAGTVYAITDLLPLLILAAIVGTISPSGKDVGPFLSLEQAILPQTTRDEQRTATFAAYNLVTSLTNALGALAVGLPALAGLAPLAGYRALIWAYVAAALALALLYTRLSPAVEAARKPAVGIARLGLHRSRGIVARLAGLFALDAFGGALFVQGLAAYWLALRFGADAATLGTIFFGVNLLAGISFLAAVPIARRIGLVRTMVFTHLPANVILLGVPFMPTLELAAGLLVARSLLSNLDVPTRQSYLMAVVAPDERSAAAGLTSVARSGASAIAPLFSGLLFAAPALGLPFLIGGSLKIIYDLALLALFHNVRPPEEVAARPIAPRPIGGRQ